MLLKTKLTHQLNAAAMAQGIEIEIFLKNISINGVKRGCSGHVVNKSTGSCAYVNNMSGTSSFYSVYGNIFKKNLNFYFLSHCCCVKLVC